MNIHGEVPRPVREIAADAENGHRSPDPPRYPLFSRSGIQKIHWLAPDPFLPRARTRGGAQQRGVRATRAAYDESRPLMALGKFAIPRRPRKQPSRKIRGAPRAPCSTSQRNLLSGRRAASAESGDDVLGEQLHLAHLLFPRHRALVEEPREPFEVAVAVAADAPQRLDLGFDLIDRPGERVFGLAHSLDGPLGGRQHLVGRVFGGILGHAKRLPEPEAAEVIVK